MEHMEHGDFDAGLGADLQITIPRDGAVELLDAVYDMLVGGYDPATIGQLKDIASGMGSNFAVLELLQQWAQRQQDHDADGADLFGDDQQLEGGILT